MDIPVVIADLGFKPENFVVVGSASLALQGIITANEVHDIDIAVSDVTYETLRQQKGWREETGAWHGILVLRKGIYDIGRSYGEWPFAGLKMKALVIQGIPVLPLEMQLAWMQTMHRLKDDRHIKLLQNYFASR